MAVRRGCLIVRAMRPIVALLIVAVVSSTALAASPAPAPYRVVHIDSPATAALFTQFENARREWLKELERAHATDGRGVFLQVGDHQLYTMRSFDKFSNFDTRNDAIAKTQGAISKAASDRYDEQSDSALAYPHTSEVWRVEDDLTLSTGHPRADRADGQRGAPGHRRSARRLGVGEALRRRHDRNQSRAQRRAIFIHLTRLGLGTRSCHTYAVAGRRKGFDAAPTVEAAASREQRRWAFPAVRRCHRAQRNQADHRAARLDAGLSDSRLLKSRYGAIVGVVVRIGR